MKLYHIAAMAKNRVIGKDNKLPWHFSEDMKFFKKLTTGHTVIMGRKTFDSIGRALPNRENFVLSRSENEKPGAQFFQSLEEALGSVKTEKAFIIGGADLYGQTLHIVDGIYLTRIDREYEGDAFYPEVPEIFEEISVEGLREADPKIEFVYYEKKDKPNVS